MVSRGVMVVDQLPVLGTGMTHYPAVQQLAEVCCRQIKNPRSKLQGIGGRKEADQKNAASCGEYVPKEIQS
jgi:hypothetical protein